MNNNNNNSSSKPFFPRPGQLAKTIATSLVISNEDIPRGSIIMFLERGTYREAIIKNGYKEENLTEEEKKELNSPYWKCLYHETIFYVQEESIEIFFEPVNLPHHHHHHQHQHQPQEEVQVELKHKKE